ncbi:hypothetical protein N7520_004986 [Penicillium odoratum]|uniref:uncharacterized protein n=1 Tax=Penicillium odoratum TaxID=1167516 RepID=UPI002548A581|nr:uncharacterized protein N7520_004986 [Penicillium odoratum]KAJ5765427.1 hypothetical protein N7520_004986 [Penicillium odoratum]
MSADLLAEFGQDSGPPQRSAGKPQAGQPQTSLISGPDHHDDDFFASLSAGNQNKPQAFVTSLANQHPAPTLRQSPGFELFKLPRHENSDVLFDAETDTPANDTEDDWGDFEEPETTINYQPERPENVTLEVRPPVADLLDSLSLKDSVSSANINNSAPEKTLAPVVNSSESTWDDDSFGDWEDFTDAPSTAKDVSTRGNHAAKAAKKVSSFPQRTLPRAVNASEPIWEDGSSGEWEVLTNAPSARRTSQHAPTEIRKKTKPAAKNISTAQQSTHEDDFEDWGDFADGPATPPISKQKPKPASSKSATPILDPRSFISSTPSPTPTVRPTNIPPPSVLLSLLVEILSALQKEALKAQPRSTPPAQKESIAIKIHTTLTTSARIIAGRSLRWKRDTILSQSMRIGPAGKPGGMKLSTVNKHEDVKESQDAVDVLRLWRERAVLFNAVVQGVGRKPVPVFTDPTALKVVLARAEEGAIKASHACALCALKRDERVLRVDEGDVNDSFGEWWTEHWGHTGCRLFWESNRALLLQR